ncbi:hypothetical protein NOLU111490_18060 [Novosphingobium lubricantis]|jgi:hypothetical protein
MAKVDIEALRAQIRAMDFVRGTPEEVAQWREDDRDSRANLTIEGMTPESNEDELFAMMMDEGVPPTLATKIIVDLLQSGAGQLAA